MTAQATVSTKPLPPPDARDEAPIVVLSTALPESRNTKVFGPITMDRERLQLLPTGRAEEAFAQIANVQSFRRTDSRASNPSAQGVTMRGLGGNATSRTLVLLDGIPVADPFFGYVSFPAFSPTRLASIDVLRGAAAGPFGPSVAGLIDMKSLAPRADRWGGVLAISELPSLQLSADGGAMAGSGVLDFTADWRRSRGDWTTPRDQRSDASSRAFYDSRFAEARWTGDTGIGTLQVKGSLLRDRRTLRFDGADNASDGVDISARLVGNDDRWTAAIYAKRRNFSSVTISATTFRPVLDQYRTPGTGFGAMAEYRPSDWIALGSDLSINHGTAYERAFSGSTGALTETRKIGGRNDKVGAFVELGQSFGPLRLAGTLRVDRWAISDGERIRRNAADAIIANEQFRNRSGIEPSGRAGGLIDFGGIAVRADTSFGFRLPTPNELYRGFTVFPVVTLANPSLRPERIRQVEAGIDWHIAERTHLALTAFDARLGNAIANVTIAPNLRERQNVSAIISRGIEANLEWRRGTWLVAGSLSALSAKMRTRDSLDGLRPAQVPKVDASVTVGYIGRSDRASVSVHHTSRAFEDDLNVNSLPAATSLDAVYRRQVTPFLGLSIRGTNITDARIVTRNQSGSIDLAPGREIWLQLDFGRME